MFRSILVILPGVASFLQTTRRPAQADDLPFVFIALPQNVPSETVEISYHLVGPFGGYGGYAAQQVGVTLIGFPRSSTARGQLKSGDCLLVRL